MGDRSFVTTFGAFKGTLLFRKWPLTGIDSPEREQRDIPGHIWE